MSLKQKGLNAYSTQAVLDASGGDIKGKDFRKTKRAFGKQRRVNRRARRKADRRGDQIADGYEGYKSYKTEEGKSARYFDKLGKDRSKRAQKAAAVAIGTVATAGMAGVFAAAPPVVAPTTVGTTAVVAPTTVGTTAVVAPTTVGTTATTTLSNADKLKKGYDYAKKGMDTYNTVQGMIPDKQVADQPETPLSVAGQAYTPSNIYGQPSLSPVAPVEKDSPYEMGAVTDPRAYMQNAAYLQQYNANPDLFSGLGDTFKSGGRIKLNYKK